MTVGIFHQIEHMMSESQFWLLLEPTEFVMTQSFVHFSHSFIFWFNEVNISGDREENIGRLNNESYTLW